MTPELDLVTAPDFLDALPGREMEELRAMRSRCQSLENSLSYVRRLIQGRLDIAGGEMQRRARVENRATPRTSSAGFPTFCPREAASSVDRARSDPRSPWNPIADVTRQLEVMLDAVISPDDSRTRTLPDEALERDHKPPRSRRQGVGAAARPAHGDRPGSGRGHPSLSHRRSNVDGLLSS